MSVPQYITSEAPWGGHDGSAAGGGGDDDGYTAARSSSSIRKASVASTSSSNTVGGALADHVAALSGISSSASARTSVSFAHTLQPSSATTTSTIVNPHHHHPQQQQHLQQQAPLYASTASSSSSSSALDAPVELLENHALNQQQQQQQHPTSPGPQPRQSIRHAPTPTMLREHEYAEASNGGAGGGYGRTRAPAVQGNAAAIAGAGVRTRTYGLARDLRGPSADSAHLPLSSGGIAKAGGSTKPSSAGSGSPTSASAPKLPTFSVEVQASNFDLRGYPIFSGRAANIKGNVRMNASEGCEVLMRLWAYTSQGSPAAVWDGIALMPPDQGSERKVFECTDRLKPDMSNVRPRPAAPGDAPGANFPASDDLVLSVPFDVRMPLGAATRFVNGEMQSLAVALPPSFEMSSSVDSKEREAARNVKDTYMRGSSQSVMTKMTLSAGGVATSMKEALEKGFGEVYRIGCFYSMSFTLQRKEEKEPRKGLLSRKSKKTERDRALDTITIPFIFLGEPAQTPPPPVYIPTLHTDILFRSGMRLAEGWDFHQANAKWSGSLKNLSQKRSVELELHMPTMHNAQPCLHAPSVFPVLLIIRPNDPNLLPAARSRTGTSSPTMSASASWVESSAGDSPSFVNGSQSPHSAAAYGSLPLSPATSLPPASLEGAEQQHNDDAESGKLAKFMRSSLHLSRIPSSLASGNGPKSPSAASSVAGQGSAAAQQSKALNSKRSRSSLASTFGRSKRPSTAPGSSLGSVSPPESLASTAMPGDRGPLDLARLVRVSLLQTTYCTSNGPSDMPKIRRRVISLAELEEVDVASIVGGPTSPGLEGVPEGESTSSAASRAVIAHARASGVRVVRGSIRVGRDTAPSFRCQGIEVKYAIKVDLLPFSGRQKSNRPASGGTASSNHSGTSLADALRSINQHGRPSMSATLQGSQSFADGASLHNYASRSSDPPRTPPLYQSTAHGGGGVMMRPGSGETSATAFAASASMHRDYRSTHGGHGSPIMSDMGGRSFIGGGGTTVIGSTVYDGEGGIGKIDKTIGALWADVRLVRGSMA